VTILYNASGKLVDDLDLIGSHDVVHVGCEQHTHMKSQIHLCESVEMFSVMQ